jgi:hypothetical protein
LGNNRWRGEGGNLVISKINKEFVLEIKIFLYIHKSDLLLHLMAFDFNGYL